MTYVRGKVLRIEPPKSFSTAFRNGQMIMRSTATIELVPETEATKVTVTMRVGRVTPLTACADGGHVISA